MTHQPYENWLLIGDPLLPDEEKALRMHLADCTICQDLDAAWNGVEYRLKHAQVVAPAAGFTGRWKEKLAVEQVRRHRRQSLVVLILSLVAAGVLALAMISLAYPLWRVPGLVFWTTIYQLFSISQWLNVIQDLTAGLLKSSGQGFTLAPLYFILMIGLVCEFGVLWMISLRRLMTPKKVRVE